LPPARGRAPVRLGAAARRRDRYLTWAERGATALAGPERARWRGWFEDEEDNLRAALAWCREDPGGAEAQLRLAAALGRFWQTYGRGREGLGRLTEALARGGPPT